MNTATRYLLYHHNDAFADGSLRCASQGQCTFGPRSSDEDIKGLVAYVMERAEAGWK
jgi:hypothetical protein